VFSGFWPGDKQQFGLLSFHSRSFLTERPEHYGSDEHLEALHAQAILASYAWLLPQANYLGKISKSY
jgi:small subunit ribosomal protein S30